MSDVDVSVGMPLGLMSMDSKNKNWNHDLRVSLPLWDNVAFGYKLAVEANL